MSAKIDIDHKLEVATTFIDRVEDVGAKDRLNSAAAMKALGMQAQPDIRVERLLPGDQPKEIEPGGPVASASPRLSPGLVLTGTASVPGTPLPAHARMGSACAETCCRGSSCSSHHGTVPRDPVTLW